MKIALATDHAGYKIKPIIRKYLEDLWHQVQDFWPDIYDKGDDYPDFMIPAVQSIKNEQNERALLICTNGIGACILANKIHTIKAATLYSVSSAQKTRRDHDSNVACLPAGEFGIQDIQDFIMTWLQEEYEGGRHDRRIKKVMNLEK